LFQNNIKIKDINLLAARKDEQYGNYCEILASLNLAVSTNLKIEVKKCIL